MTDLRDSTQSSAGIQSTANVFMQHVYTWMTVALGITAVAAYITSTNMTILRFFHGSFIMSILLIVAIFGLVFYLSSSMHKLSATTATVLFAVYAALMGIFLGPILLIYTSASITQAFVVTAGMFGAMSIYGTVTKRDLTGMGAFLTMGLFGLIIAMVVNIFLKSSALEFGISFIGVIIFVGLTAYDTQKIRQMADDAPLDDTTAVRRGALLGALTLYLDFINIFLMLLRLLNRD